MHLYTKKDHSSKALKLSRSFHPLTPTYTFMFYIKANRETFVELPRSVKGTVLDTVGVMLLYFYSGRTHRQAYAYLRVLDLFPGKFSWDLCPDA